jgi:hypothetical protein
MNCRKLFLLLAVPVFLSLNSTGQPWNLKLDKAGIKVYTRSVTGSNVQEFKGEVVAKSNMATILGVIDSIVEYPKWMYECTYAERVKKINRESGYIYTVIHSPWPLSDRDLNTYYQVKQDSLSKVITVAMKGVKDYLPEKKDIVRIPAMTGFWQLIPVAKGVTKIVYQVHCESGGSVPASIVNAYITDTPYFNLLNLRKIVESPLYPKKNIADVKEF